VDIVEKIEAKIYNLLPTNENEGLSENDVLDILFCSHGSFYAAVRSLLKEGKISFVNSGRKRLYYKLEKPPDAQEKRKESASKKKPKSILASDYNDFYEGIFHSVEEWLDVVSSASGYEWAKQEGGNLYLGIDGNISRYLFASVLDGAAVEIWRFRIKQTYRRKYGT